VVVVVKVLYPGRHFELALRGARVVSYEHGPVSRYLEPPVLLIFVDHVVLQHAMGASLFLVEPVGLEINVSICFFDLFDLDDELGVQVVGCRDLHLAVEALLEEPPPLRPQGVRLLRGGMSVADEVATERTAIHWAIEHLVNRIIKSFAAVLEVVHATLPPLRPELIVTAYSILEIFRDTTHCSLLVALDASLIVSHVLLSTDSGEREDNSDD